MIGVGDRVRILGNAKDTCWEFGYVMDIDGDGALINFGSRDNPIYGMGIRKRMDELRLVGHDFVCGKEGHRR